MNDYLWNFPIVNITNALKQLLPLGDVLTQNALGDPRDEDGFIVEPAKAVWYGRQGSAAMVVDDMAGGTIQIPARGDPALFYVHVRTDEPIDFKAPMTTVSGTRDSDSAAVLGVWAGDE